MFSPNWLQHFLKEKLYKSLSINYLFPSLLCAFCIFNSGKIKSGYTKCACFSTLL